MGHPSRGVGLIVFSKSSTNDAPPGSPLKPVFIKYVLVDPLQFPSLHWVRNAIMGALLNGRYQ